MIIYVDIEHLRVKKLDPKQWKKHLSRALDIKYKLEEVSGDQCLIVHYENLSPELLSTLKPKAVLVSGNMTEFQHYEEEKLAGLRAVYREAAQPTLGFCGGAQMMAETFGSRAAAIDESESGDMMNGNWKERTHESGFKSVRQTVSHPIFNGLADEFIVSEAHYWEIKGLPDGFKNHAETDITTIQFMAHEELPLFATQFHPEAWDKDHQDGRLFLKNFFELAGVLEKE